MPYSNRSTVVFSAARVKPPVRLLIDLNGTLATAFAAGQVHQSVTLALGDRICLAAQSTGTENGIYSVNASGAPTRVSDLPAGSLASGVSFAVTNGTHKGKIYVNTNADGSDTVGTDALTFAEPPITVAWGDIGGTLSNQTDLQSALDAKAASSHQHDASDINAGTLAHERGGLEADVSGLDGLLRITGGATSAVTVTSFALTFLDDSTADAVRTTIGAASAAEVAAITSGYSRRKGVIARVDNTAAPPTEVSGDRYLLDDTGASHANWDGAAANDIVEFDGSSWVATSPTEGWIVYSDGSDTDWLYVDDGSPAWNERTAGGGVTDHGALTGNGDDDHTHYSLADGTRWTTTPTASRVVISDVSGNLVVSSVSTTTLGYLDATSSIQTQLDGKSATGHGHTSGDVSDFDEAVDDRVAALLVAGTGISLTYDDGANTLTVAATGGSGGGLTVTKKTAGYTAVAGDLVVCDATGGAFTVTMPASPSTDDRIGVYVEHGSASLTVTIQGNGKTLAEYGSSLVLKQPGDLIIVQYDGVKWVIESNGIQILSRDSLAAGDIHETNDQIKLHDASAAADLRVDPKSLGAPYVEDSTLGTDAGDLYYRPTANTHWSNLKIGPRGSRLHVSDSDLPAWGGPGFDTWTSQSATEANSWWSIAYGNGLFVALAQDGTNRVMTSHDGINWTARSAAEANQWRGLTYGNGLFVAVSLDGTNRVMTSPDGITWTARSAAEANLWEGVTYGNGLFVAVSRDGTNRVMTSPDGITWTARSAAAAKTWEDVIYSDGLFVAVASGGGGTSLIMTSPDGITWTSRTATEPNTWYSITYGNGLFVAVSESGTNRVMTSPDGITWTARSAASASSWYSITYGNGLFVAVSVAGDDSIMTSPDGITWTARTEPEANQWRAVTYGNGLFVAVSGNGTNRVMTSGKQLDRILI